MVFTFLNATWDNARIWAFWWAFLINLTSIECDRARWEGEYGRVFPRRMRCRFPFRFRTPIPRAVFDVWMTQRCCEPFLWKHTIPLSNMVVLRSACVPIECVTWHAPHFGLSDFSRFRLFVIDFGLVHSFSRSFLISQCIVALFEWPLQGPFRLQQLEWCRENKQNTMAPFIIMNAILSFAVWFFRQNIEACSRHFIVYVSIWEFMRYSSYNEVPKRCTMGRFTNIEKRHVYSSESIQRMMKMRIFVFDRQLKCVEKTIVSHQCVGSIFQDDWIVIQNSMGF